MLKHMISWQGMIIVCGLALLPRLAAGIWRAIRKRRRLRFLAELAAETSANAEEMREVAADWSCADGDGLD